MVRVWRKINKILVFIIAISHNIIQEILSHLFTSNLPEQRDLITTKPKGKALGRYCL